MEQELVALLPRLRRMARALCRDEDEADELVQQAVERALVNRHRFQPGTRLDAWMHRIIQNLWRDEYRRRKRRGPVVELEAVRHMAGGDGRREGEVRLTLRAVREAIRRLPEDQRLALVLVCLEGLPYREAAERMGVPLGTLMSRLGRARRRLALEVGLLAGPETSGGTA